MAQLTAGNGLGAQLRASRFRNHRELIEAHNKKQNMRIETTPVALMLSLPLPDCMNLLSGSI